MRIKVLFKVFLKTSLLIGIGLTFGSCEFGIDVNLLISNLFDKNIEYVSATISLPHTDSSDSSLKKLIESNFISTENYRIEEIDYQKYLFFDTHFPLYFDDNEKCTALLCFYSLIGDANQDTDINANLNQNPSQNQILPDLIKINNTKTQIAFKVSQGAYQKLSRDAEMLYFTKLDLDKIKLEINLQNNTGVRVISNVGMAYVDEKPVPFHKNIEMLSKESLKIRIANVLKDYAFLSETIVPIASIYKPNS